MSTDKRPASPEKTEESDSEAWIGPMPSEAAISKPKKRKGKNSMLILVYNPNQHTY